MKICGHLSSSFRFYSLFRKGIHRDHRCGLGILVSMFHSSRRLCWWFWRFFLFFWLVLSQRDLRKCLSFSWFLFCSWRRPGIGGRGTGIVVVYIIISFKKKNIFYFYFIFIYFLIKKLCLYIFFRYYNNDSMINSW